GICGAGAFAADNADWILTTADLRAERISLKSIDSTGAHVSTQDGAGKTIALDQFLQLDRASPLRAAGARFILCLADGERIAGDPISVTGEVLKWNSAAFGQVQSPLRRVIAIIRPGVPATGEDSSEPQAQDVIQL